MVGHGPLKPSILVRVQVPQPTRASLETRQYNYLSNNIMNELISTSTQLLLLNQKVTSLESYMNWTIGGITIIVTVLMAIFAVIQFVYQKKIEKDEIQKVEKNLFFKIEKDLTEKEELLKVFANKKISEVEVRVNKYMSLMSADIARRFAIDCSKDNIPATALAWWTSAAADYSENDSEKLCNTCINEAKSCLFKICSKSDKESLFEYSSSITGNISRLKKRHPFEAGILEELLKDKLKSEPITTQSISTS